MPQQKQPKRVFNYEPPSEKHAKFHEAWHSRTRIICGGYGSGKSQSCLAEVLRHLLHNPKFKGKNALVVGTTAGHNEDTLLPLVKQILTYESNGRNLGYIEDVDYFVKKSPHLKITLPFGSVIDFRTLLAGQRIAGGNYALGYADEIDKTDLQTWLEVTRRVRTVEGGFIIGACNPSNKSHWLYKHYFKSFDEKFPEPPDDEKTWETETGSPEPGVWLGYLTTYDNKFLPADAIAGYERDHGYSNLERKRAIMGRFVSMEGCVFNNFDRDKHTYDDSKPANEVHSADRYVTADMPRYCGVDFGGIEKSAAVFIAKGVRDDGQSVFYAYDEHYKSLQSPQQNARDILAKGKHHTIIQTWSDHEHGNYLAMREEGLLLTKATKGKDSIEAGVGLIRNLLDTGRLKIGRTLTHLIEEFEVYTYDPVTGKPKDKWNHLLDALRYVLWELAAKPGVNIYSPTNASAQDDVQEAFDKHTETQKLVRAKHDELVTQRKHCIGMRNGKPIFVAY